MYSVPDDETQKLEADALPYSSSVYLVQSITRTGGSAQDTGSLRWVNILCAAGIHTTVEAAVHERM